MNKISSQFQLVHHPLLSEYSFPYKGRTTTSIVIIKRYILILFISFTIILLICIFIAQRQINALNKSLSSLHKENTSLRTDISSLQSNNQWDDAPSSKRELIELKGLVSSLSNQLNTITNDLKSKGVLVDNSDDDLRDSLIITELSQIEFIHKQFSSSQKSYRLLYRATKAGDSFEDLYNSIRSTKSTLIIIKSSKGAIFGGYLKNEWMKRDHHLVISEKSLFSHSFLFNVNKKKYYTQLNDTRYPPKGILSFGPDLTLEDSFLSSSENSSIFPSNYNYVMNYADKSALTEGEEKFSVEEVEIYEVGTIADL